MKDWFKDGLRRKLGRGNKIRFWEEVWLGNLSLRETFPRLFSMSEDRGKVIGNLGEWRGEILEWNLNWQRIFFSWEVAELDELTNLLQSVTISRVTDDTWVWFVDNSMQFSSFSAYRILQSKFGSSVTNSGEDGFSFKHFWKSKVPKKVLAFCWQMLLARIPTKSNLLTRNVLQGGQNLLCVFCDESLESVQHLFLSCNTLHRCGDRFMVGLDILWFCRQTL